MNEIPPVPGVEGGRDVVILGLFLRCLWWSLQGRREQA